MIDGLSSTAQLSVGETVSGLGIPNGTTIINIASNNAIWISQAPTASYNGDALVFGSSQTDGQDTLIAGSGNSELYAGTGGDLLIGGSAVTVPGPGGVTEYEPAAPSGRDVLVGGAGNDLLIAAPGSPGAVMLAGTGNDTLVGENGGRDLMAMDGNASSTDAYRPGAGNDLFLGGEGDNYLSAWATRATLPWWPAWAAITPFWPAQASIPSTPRSTSPNGSRQ